MAHNEEVAGSISHANMALTIIVHLNFDKGSCALLYRYLKTLNV